MKDKMTTDDDLYDTPARRLVYVMNRVRRGGHGIRPPRTTLKRERYQPVEGFRRNASLPGTRVR